MARNRPLFAAVLPGIHLTSAAWLPDPDPSSGWHGWIRRGPREYLVHPQARDELVRLLSETIRLAGMAVVVNEPEQTEAAALAAMAAQMRLREQARKQQAPGTKQRPPAGQARRIP